MKKMSVNPCGRISNKTGVLLVAILAIVSKAPKIQGSLIKVTDI